MGEWASGRDGRVGVEMGERWDGEWASEMGVEMGERWAMGVMGE